MMVNNQANKVKKEKKEVQEVKEEKIDWQTKVKLEFPCDWLERLAAIQTNEGIIRTEARDQDINWEKVYQAYQISRYYISSSLYNREEVTRINQCYQQFLQGEEYALKNIYYFSNHEPDRVPLSQLLAWLKNPNCELVSLNLRFNQIDAAGAQEIAEALNSKHCKLTSLNFSMNKIGNAGVKEIAKVLKSERCKLISLNLEKNEIDNVGAKEIATALSDDHCKLMSLNFGLNAIGDVGAKEIAVALKNEHCKLTSLNLWGNQIGEVGVKEIAIALKNEHCKLTSLNLWSNQIGEAGAKEIAIALKNEHCKLISLNLWSNQIGDAGVKRIATVLKSEHCKLISLDLRQNQIGDASAQEIANAMKSGHFRLTSLNLQFNRIGEVGKLAITLALKHPYCPCDLHIKLDSDVEKYILKFNEEWSQAQALYMLLSHPDRNLQHLSMLPPYVTIKVLFPYLFDIFKDELKPVAEQKRVGIPTYAHDDQGKIKTKNGKPIVIKTFWVLRKVSTGELEEPQSQVGDCFLDNHYEHFKVIQSQRQDTPNHIVITPK